MIRVLIIDDEVRLAEAYKKQLVDEGMDVTTAASAGDALAIVPNRVFDVAVVDIKLPDGDGVELLLKLKQMEPTLEVIMLTGYASVNTAIQSMKLGAYDYLTKPCKLTELSNVIVKASEKKALLEKNIILGEHLQRMRPRDELIGASKQMKKVKELITLMAGSSSPVLLLGETGTGKDLAARAIHDQSHRSENPFVAINASTLQPPILESELFGYKKGAFTGAEGSKMGLLEIANEGTFFVDEVADTGLSIQAKVLRVLETGSFIKLGDTRETRVNVRYIFATNKDLKMEVEQGRFRKDLYYRINGFTIALPPLREKPEDIPLLAHHFVDKFAKEAGRRKSLSKEALDLLRSYDWPGNVRELSMVIHRSVLVSGDRQVIMPDDFPDDLVSNALAEKTDRKPKAAGLLSLAKLEAEYVEKVLDSVSGNKSKAARLLGISRRKLYSKLGENPDPDEK
ncbi:MAG: Transcriptional regulatory protein ZraR [Syntrophorhabdaceae bacterium PtaU1.Bin034]|jgi:DNA-binding NtrC family response regulator|nr:MAG: Transcriptional regulatory protein ZraR [Syntrophorhabdaceae bacterium PtaU1.Bin034]